MRISINDIEILIPGTLAEYKLSQRIDFQKEHGHLLEEMVKSILLMPDDLDREIEFAELQLEICYRGFSFWSGIDLDVLKEYEDRAALAAVYMAATKSIDEYKIPSLVTSYQWDGVTWLLPTPDLKRGSKLTFGEFIDSKSMIKDSIATGRNKWETIKYLAAIYLRREGEHFEESFLFDGSDRLKLMGELPLDIAIIIGHWFDLFSEYVNKHFPVFFGTKKDKDGKNMARHFERWGWVNFLKSISKTKEFDIQGSGLNSIQCARLAPLFDVLLYASESKEYNEASNADQAAVIRQR